MKGKTKSILALTATLVIGIILGMLLAGQLVRSRVAHMRELRQSGRFKHHLIESVDPSDAQRAAITPILEDFGQRMETMHHRHMQELRENHELLRTKLSEHLTPAQVKKLEKELRRMAGPRFKGHKGKRHRKKNKKK